MRLGKPHCFTCEGIFLFPTHFPVLGLWSRKMVMAWWLDFVLMVYLLSMFKVSYNLVLPWRIEERSWFCPCSVKAYIWHSVILKAWLSVEQEVGSRNCILGVLNKVAGSEKVLEVREALWCCHVTAFVASVEEESNVKWMRSGGSQGACSWQGGKKALLVMFGRDWEPVGEMGTRWKDEVDNHEVTKNSSREHSGRSGNW